jgi:hypothetical protein
MTTIVRGLFASFLKGKELVAQVDERHVLVLPAKLELEYPPVERERFLDIAHLERNVIEAYGASFLDFMHETLAAVTDPYRKRGPALCCQLHIVSTLTN